MKVYVLTEDPYDELATIIGVYRKCQDALDAADKLCNQAVVMWTMKVAGQTMTGLSGGVRRFFRIEPMELL